jgi:hypothetical protein
MVILQFVDQQSRTNLKIRRQIEMIFQPINASSSYWPFYLSFHTPNLDTFSHLKFNNSIIIMLEFTLSKVFHNLFSYKVMYIKTLKIFFEKLYCMKLLMMIPLGPMAQGFISAFKDFDFF